MIKPQSSFSRDINNYTTYKNLQSKSRFNLQNQNIDLHEPQETIAIQEQILNMRFRPQAQSGISPRRSIVRQNQIWSESNDKVNLQDGISARRISEDYYSEQVAAKTTIFLTKMHNLLQSQELVVRQKRRHIIDLIVNGIRSEWQSVKRQLTSMIAIWSQDSQQRQISYFLQHAESKVSGQLLQIGSKISIKKEEMELYLAKIKQVQLEQAIIAHQQIVQRSFLIKQTFKQIWARDYQFQVNQILREVSRIVNTTSGRSYIYPLASLQLQRLHFKVDRTLLSDSKFKPTTVPQKASPISKIQVGITNQKAINGLVSNKTNQLQVLRCQRQAQWEVLCRQTLNNQS